MALPVALLDPRAAMAGALSKAAHLNTALDNGRRLYVGNLDYRTQDETLAELFAEFGTVESAQHLADRENPDWKRGFGFVTLSTEAEANAAADAMNGAEVDGRVIKVNIAKPR